MYASMFTDDSAAPDRVAHRGIELRAVGEDVDLVVGMDRRLARRLDDVQELVAVGPKRLRDPVVDARREEQDERRTRR